MNVVKAKLLVVRRHWTEVGKKQEQERIIKLITANCNDGLGEDLVPGGCEHDVIIALIKNFGE